jgi:hypothetical protein
MFLRLKRLDLKSIGNYPKSPDLDEFLIMWYPEDGTFWVKGRIIVLGTDKGNK